VSISNHSFFQFFLLLRLVIGITFTYAVLGFVRSAGFFFFKEKSYQGFQKLDRVHYRIVKNGL
jgi:hypothetical protein